MIIILIIKRLNKINNNEQIYYLINYLFGN